MGLLHFLFGALLNNRKNKKQSQNNQSNISSDSYHRAYEDGYDDCRMNHNDVSRQNEYDYQDDCECDCGYDNSSYDGYDCGYDNNSYNDCNCGYDNNCSDY
jgi:hypothetical protein